MNRYELLLEKQQDLLYSTRNYIQYIIAYNLKNMYIPESLCCIPETNILL